jgi:transcriptional regulator with XRE-family HTH domain
MSEADPQRASLGARLRAAREMAGLSQGQVAKKLGLHRPSVTEMEVGRRRVSSEELATLADLYQVEAAWLLKGVEEPNPEDLRVDLAARELAKLDDKDLERVLALLNALKR